MMAELYPRLNELLALKNGTVADFGPWEENRWRWVLQWDVVMSVEDEETVASLEDLFRPISPVKDCDDRWCWKLSVAQAYTVKSAYRLLIQSIEASQLDETERNIMKKFWLTAAPSK